MNYDLGDWRQAQDSFLKACWVVLLQLASGPDFEKCYRCHCNFQSCPRHRPISTHPTHHWLIGIGFPSALPNTHHHLGALLGNISHLGHSSPCFLQPFPILEGKTHILSMKPSSGPAVHKEGACPSENWSIYYHHHLHLVLNQHYFAFLLLYLIHLLFQRWLNSACKALLPNY